MRAPLKTAAATWAPSLNIIIIIITKLGGKLMNFLNTLSENTDKVGGGKRQILTR